MRHGWVRQGSGRARSAGGAREQFAGGYAEQGGDVGRFGAFGVAELFGPCAELAGGVVDFGDGGAESFGAGEGVAVTAGGDGCRFERGVKRVECVEGGVAGCDALLELVGGLLAAVEAVGVACHGGSCVVSVAEPPRLCRRPTPAVAVVRFVK
jgi:hypothetical protein